MLLLRSPHTANPMALQQPAQGRSVLPARSAPGTATNERVTLQPQPGTKTVSMTLRSCWRRTPSGSLSSIPAYYVPALRGVRGNGDMWLESKPWQAERSPRLPRITSRKQEPGRKPSCLCSKVGGTGVFPVVRAGQGASRAVVVAGDPTCVSIGQ